MADITETKRILDEINTALSTYDAVMKEQARDILFRKAFGVQAQKTPVSAPNAPDDLSSHNDVGENGRVEFNSLIEKWTPTTQADWALLGAYYIQRILGHQNVTGFSVNRELKHHGYRVSNVTDCFTANMETEPARMLQTKKSGKSKQAKKLYVVTTAGLKYVEERLGGSRET
jgi:hypothetical protein